MVSNVFPPYQSSLRRAALILSLDLEVGAQKGKLLKVLKKPTDAELADTLFKHMKCITAIQIAELKNPKESISFRLISTGIRHCFCKSSSLSILQYQHLVYNTAGNGVSFP